MRYQTRPFSEITLYNVADFTPIPVPQFLSRVECGTGTTGFVSPAEDYMAAELDLNEYHNIKKYVTFLVEAVGDSMIDAGITENDLLIVDTTLPYRDKDVVVCYLNGCLKAKVLVREKGKLFLKSRNPEFAPIEIREHDDLRIFGVVKGFSRNFRRD